MCFCKTDSPLASNSQISNQINRSCSERTCDVLTFFQFWIVFDGIGLDIWGECIYLSGVFWAFENLKKQILIDLI